MKLVTKNAEETVKFGIEFANRLSPGDMLLLYGDLGAGKTTFVQALAKGFGIKDRILSPTFILYRNHKIENNKIKNLNHVDLYRIENPHEIEAIGLSEILDDKASVTVIEWADRLKNFEPVAGFKIRFEYLGENEREITIEKLG